MAGVIMNAEEIELRKKVVEESLRWVGTPYHHAGNVFQVGVDCAYFLIEVFKTIGIEQPSYIPSYKPGVAGLREGQTLYTKILENYAYVCESRGPTSGIKPRPADIILFRFVHLTHSAIVVHWPYVVHAFLSEGKVVVSDVNKTALLMRRWEKTLCLKGWS